MKTLNKIMVLLLTILPISLLAHEGHVHTGTLLENVAHFVLTNGYLAISVLIVSFIVLRLRNKTNNLKLKQRTK